MRGENEAVFQNPEGGAGVSGDASVSGQAKFANTGTAGTASTDASVEKDLVSKPRDMQYETERAQTADQRAQGEVNRELGADGQSVIHDGGTGMAEREVRYAAGDTNAARTAARAEEMANKDATESIKEGAIDQSGYKDPESQMGKAQFAVHEKTDPVYSKVSEAETAKSRAEYVVAHPQAEAKAQASNAADDAIRENAPFDANKVQGQANKAAGAVANPEAAAQHEIDLEIEAKEREAAMKVGVSGTVSTGSGNRPEPGDKDKT
jgi:hypothetical protein